MGLMSDALPYAFYFLSSINFLTASTHTTLLNSTNVDTRISCNLSGSRRSLTGNPSGMPAKGFPVV